MKENKEPKMKRMTRRSFLKSGALLTAGTAAVLSPTVIPTSALGLDGHVAPSERVTMGLIGCGSHGRGWNLDMMFRNPMQQVVAVCDVDQNYLNAAQKKTNDFYSQKSRQDWKGCDAYRDFRDLVNRKDIDAVDIVTPDHWHVLLAVFAMKAGKDVICEKPTLTIREGRILSDTQKATQRVFQTASENRSIECYQHVVNLARNGLLGKLRNIKVLLPPGNTSVRDPGVQSDEPSARIIGEVPPELDYETWLGPAPVVPYIPARVHYNWRWNFAYSGGVLTDWGSHLINSAQWANDTDDTGPVEVEGKGDFPDFNDVWNTPATFNINYRYANGVTMNVWTEVPGIKLEGSKGWVLCRGWRGNLTASDDRLLNVKFEGDRNLGRPESTVKTGEGIGGEHVDFALCVKSRKPCYYTAECGHRNHTIAHMGNISMILDGAKLQWNPDKERFEGNRADEANVHFCSEREQREPWSFDKVDSWINVG